MSEVAVQHALIEPPPLLTQRPELPPAVEQVVQRALAKEPGQRFPGILAFAGALEEAIGQPTSPGEYGGDLRTAPVSRRRLLLGLGGAGILALGGGLAWFALSRHAGTPARPAAIPAATQPLFIYTGHRAPLTSVAWSPDGTRIASADAAGGVQIWQARDEGHTPIGTLLTIHEPFETHTYLISAPSPPTPAVNTLAWAPSAQQIALGLDQVDTQEIRIWDLASNQDVQTFIASFLGACVAWSPDGTRVAGASYTGSYACSVDIWRLDTGNLIATLTYPEPNDGTYHALDNLPLGVSWSPDGGSIAGASGRIIQLWSAQNGAFQQGLSLATGTSGTVAWSPNSRYIVSTGATYATAPGFVSPLVQVWDAQAGTLALTYRGHRATVNQAVWSPNGQYIASASDDHTVHVCNALTGTTSTVYRGHRGKVSGVSWSPDGRYIASASDDQTVHIWNSGLSS